MSDEEDYGKKEIQTFIENFIYFSKLSESGSVTLSEVLEMPYFLFEAFINSQLKMKTDENRQVEKIKRQGAQQRVRR